jgi:hypothetical protein
MKKDLRRGSRSTMPRPTSRAMRIGVASLEKSRHPCQELQEYQRITSF